MARVINKNQEIDAMQGGLQKQNYYNRMVWSESENNLKMIEQKSGQQYLHPAEQSQPQQQFVNKQSRREYIARPKIAISNKLPAEFSQNSRNNSVSASNSKEPQCRLGSSDKSGVLQQNKINAKNSSRSDQYTQSFQSDSFQYQSSKANEKNYKILSQFPEINGMNQHQYLKQVESSQSYYVQAQPSGIDFRGKVRKNPLNQSEGSSSKEHLHQSNNYNQNKQEVNEFSYDNGQYVSSSSSPTHNQMASTPTQNLNQQKGNQGQKNQLRQLVKFMHEQEQQKNSNSQQLQQNHKHQQLSQQQSREEGNQFDSLQINHNLNSIQSNQENHTQDSKRQLNSVQQEDKNKTKSHLKTNNFKHLLHHSNSQPADVSNGFSTSNNKQIQNYNTQTHYFNVDKLQNNITHNNAKIPFDQQQQGSRQQYCEGIQKYNKNGISIDTSSYNQPQKSIQEGIKPYQLSSQQDNSNNLYKNIQSPVNTKPTKSQQYYVMKYASPNIDQSEQFKSNSVSEKSISVQIEQRESQSTFQKRQGSTNQESIQQANDISYNQYFMKQTASSNLTSTKRRSSRIIQQQNETQISSNTSSNSLSNQTGQHQSIQKESLQVSQSEQTITSPLLYQNQPQVNYNLLKDMPTSSMASISKNTDSEFLPTNSGAISNRRNTQIEEKNEITSPKDGQQQMQLRRSFEIQDMQQQRYFIKMQKKQNQLANKKEINSPTTPQIIGSDQSQQMFFNKPSSANNKLNILCSPQQKGNTSISGHLANVSNNQNKLISIAKVLNIENFNAQSTGAIASADSLNKQSDQIQSPTYCVPNPSRPQTTREIKDNLVNQKQIKTPQIEQIKSPNNGKQIQDSNFIKPQLTEQEILKLFSQNNKKSDQAPSQKNKSSSDRIQKNKEQKESKPLANGGLQLKINLYNNETYDTDPIEHQKQQQKPQKLTFVKGVSLQQLKELSQQNTPRSIDNEEGDNFTHKIHQLDDQMENKNQQFGQNFIEQAIQNTDLMNKPATSHSSQNLQEQPSSKSKFSQLREDSRIQALKLRMDYIQTKPASQTNTSNGDLSPVENIMMLKNKHSKKVVLQQVYSNNRSSQAQQHKSNISNSNISANFQNFKYDIVQRQLLQIQKNSDESTPQGKSENQNYFFHSRFQDQPSVILQTNDVTNINVENTQQKNLIKKPRSDIIPQQPSVVNMEKFKSHQVINSSAQKGAKYESERNSLADILSQQTIQDQSVKENDEVQYQSNNQSIDSSNNQSFQSKILQRRAFSSHNNFSAQDSKQSSNHKKTSLDSSFSQIDYSANKNQKRKSFQQTPSDNLPLQINERIMLVEDAKLMKQGISHNSKSASYFIQPSQMNHNLNINKQSEQQSTSQRSKNDEDNNTQPIQKGGVDQQVDRLPIIKNFKNVSNNTPTQVSGSSGSNKSLNQGFQNFANYLHNYNEQNLQISKEKSNPEQKFEERQLSFRKSVQQLNNNIKTKWSHIRNKLIQNNEDDSQEITNKTFNKVKSSMNLNENQTGSDNNTPTSPNKLNQILTQNTQNQADNIIYNSPNKLLSRGNSFSILKQAFTPQQSSRQKDNFENFITKTGYKNNQSTNASPLNNNNSFQKQYEGRNRFQIKMNQLESDNSKLFTNFFQNQQKNTNLTSSNSDLKSNQPTSARDYEKESSSPKNIKIKINELITVKQISPNIRKVVHVPTLKVFILRSIEINSTNRTSITNKIANAKSLSEKYPFIINPIIQVFYNTPENHISILSEYQPLKSLKKVINCFSTINERSLQSIVIQLISKLKYVDEQDLQSIYVSFDNLLFDNQGNIKLDCSSREKQTPQKDELLKTLKKQAKMNKSEESQYDTKRSNSSKYSSQTSSSSLNFNQKDNKNESKHDFTLPVQLGLLLIEAALGEDMLYDYSQFQFSSFASSDQKRDCENCCFLHKIFNNKIILYSDQQSILIQRMLTHQYTTNFIDFICQCLQNEPLNKLSNHLFVSEITNQKFNSINELIPISLKFESEQEIDSQKKLDQILDSLSNSIPNFSSSVAIMNITKSSLKETHPFVDMLQKDLGLASWNILGQLQKAYDTQLAY